MKPLALVPLSLILLANPASAADLDGPAFRERDVVIERPAPSRVVERERIIEHHYYEPAPLYTERRVYVEPREYVYRPRVYGYAEPYAYAGWRPHYFFPRRDFWHHHHW